MKDVDGRLVPEIILNDDEGAPINASNPLPVELQVVPTITIATVAVQGDDTDPIIGSATDAAWNGSATDPTWQALFKYIANGIESIRADVATEASLQSLIGLVGDPTDDAGDPTVIGLLKQIAANTSGT